MKAKVYLFLAIIFLFLGFSSFAVLAQAGTPTPVVSPTVNLTPESPAFIVTVTPRFENIDLTCPSGTPVGWLTVTPAWSWWMACEHCIAAIPTSTPEPTPTVSTPVFSDFQIYADGACRGNYYHGVYSLNTNMGYKSFGDYRVRSLSCGYLAGSRPVYARVTIQYTFKSNLSYQGYSTNLVFRVV